MYRLQVRRHERSRRVLGYPVSRLRRSARPFFRLIACGVIARARGSPLVSVSYNRSLLVDTFSPQEDESARHNRLTVDCNLALPFCQYSDSGAAAKGLDLEGPRRQAEVTGGSRRNSEAAQTLGRIRREIWNSGGPKRREP